MALIEPVLGFSLGFADLYSPSGLKKVDQAFLTHLDEADLLVSLAPHLDDFVGRLFAIDSEIGNLSARHEALRRSMPASGCSSSVAPRRRLNPIRRKRLRPNSPLYSAVPGTDWILPII